MAEFSPEKFKQVVKAAGQYPCGFIGGGNMAMAIVSGLIEAKMFEGNELVVSGTREESLVKWKHLNVVTTLDNCLLVGKCRIIFLCVKPNALQGVKESLSNFHGGSRSFEHQTVVSILAGTTLDMLKGELGFLRNMNYVRAMPNTPLMVCAGATALTRNEGQSVESIDNFNIIRNIFGKLGIVETVDESKFHAITGLSGSGPAYVYTIIEALSDAGVKQGLPRDLATKFAAQTLFGSSKTIIDTGIHTGQAKEQVTSAGGTTIFGVHELEKGRIRDTLMNAVEAATKRSMDLASKK